jgi:hypothetical protein
VVLRKGGGEVRYRVLQRCLHFNKGKETIKIARLLYFVTGNIYTFFEGIERFKASRFLKSSLPRKPLIHRTQSTT